MLYYCKRHDLGFCKAHAGQCLRNDCTFIPAIEMAPALTFCSVCVGVIAEQKPKEVQDANVRIPGDRQGGTKPDDPQMPRVPRRRKRG